jgi:hypothetical protein
MRDLISFVSQNTGLVILISSIACIILGRVWSNSLNWGEITDPKFIIRKGKNYQVLNLYKGESWTENWNVGSIVCFKSYHHRFFVKYSREIYVSGDKIRFADDGPGIGTVYEAIFPKTTNGLIVMKPVKIPPKV